jgi:hypothetical protein
MKMEGPSGAVVNVYKYGSFVTVMGMRKKSCRFRGGELWTGYDVYRKQSKG